MYINLSAIFIPLDPCNTSRNNFLKNFFFVILNHYMYYVDIKPIINKILYYFQDMPGGRGHWTGNLTNRDTF